MYRRSLLAGVVTQRELLLLLGGAEELELALPEIVLEAGRAVGAGAERGRAAVTPAAGPSISARRLVRRATGIHRRACYYYREQRARIFYPRFFFRLSFISLYVVCCDVYRIWQTLEDGGFDSGVRRTNFGGRNSGGVATVPVVWWTGIFAKIELRIFLVYNVARAAELSQLFDWQFSSKYY